MIRHSPASKYFHLLVLVLSLGASAPASAESTGIYIDDATITTKVKEAIFADTQLKVLQVQVETTHGIVILDGTVDTQAQESEALYVASHTDGVVAVTDKLSIKKASVE
jgi:hyperosmotically inducible protein